VGMSDGVEGDLMDEEARRALEMSEEELNTRFGRGSRRPKLARKPPLRVRQKKEGKQAAGVVAEATEATEVEWNPASVVFADLETSKRRDEPVAILSRPAIRIQP
jgi:hypothetical protein